MGGRSGAFAKTGVVGGCESVKVTVDTGVKIIVDTGVKITINTGVKVTVGPGDKVTIDIGVKVTVDTGEWCHGCSWHWSVVPW